MLWRIPIWCFALVCTFWAAPLMAGSWERLPDCQLVPDEYGMEIVSTSNRATRNSSFVSILWTVPKRTTAFPSVWTSRQNTSAFHTNERLRLAIRLPPSRGKLSQNHSLSGRSGSMPVVQASFTDSTRLLLLIEARCPLYLSETDWRAFTAFLRPCQTG